MRHAISVITILSLTACDTVATTGTSEPVKLDAPCRVEGTYEVTGDFLSFTTWTFTIENDALIDSHTDDLDARDWPTTLVSGGGTGLWSLVQITDASDQVIQTVIHVREGECIGTRRELQPVDAYTITTDLRGTFFEVTTITVGSRGTGSGWSRPNRPPGPPSRASTSFSTRPPPSFTPPTTAR
jgi:hypothetical protein